MKRFLTTCLALALFTVASPSHANAANDPIVAEVTQANDAMQLATQNYDSKAIDKILTSDFVLVGSRGLIFKRAAFVADIADRSATWISNKSSDLVIHHYNDDTALVIGILRMQYKMQNKMMDRHIRFIDAWVKQDGQWKWASSQVSNMDPPAKPAK
jgi:ketosteroid isomerase-like protein